MNLRSDETPERLWRLVDMPAGELEQLPFGAVVIDLDGKIAEYNEYEARLSHLERAAVIGKNFFRDVAPCTAVQEFEGRLRAFAKSEAAVSESFDYFFPFKHGTVEVTITFVHLKARKQYLIAVERQDPANRPASE